MTQPRVGDHQVRSVTSGGGHRATLCDLDRSNVVPPLLEYVGKQHANHYVILHQEDSQRVHGFTSPPSLVRFARISEIFPRRQGCRQFRRRGTGYKPDTTPLNRH
jgi:hypothetical protein